LRRLGAAGRLQSDRAGLPGGTQGEAAGRIIPAMHKPRAMTSLDIAADLHKWRPRRHRELGSLTRAALFLTATSPS
jgi:hypothetical protein